VLEHVAGAFFNATISKPAELPTWLSKKRVATDFTSFLVLHSKNKILF